MRKSARAIVVIGSALALSGCVTTRVARPESISLADALVEVIESLNAMADVESPLKTGLVPAEVIVTFDVTAAQKTETGAEIEVVPTGIVSEIPRIGGTWSTEVRGSRGNQITIKFRNILFTSDKELLSRMAPEEIDELLQKLKELGWNIKLR